MKHCGTKTILTERLCLRAFAAGDEAALFAMLSDARVTQYLIFKPHLNLDKTRAELGEWLKRYEKNTCYNWAIVLRRDDLLIGNIYLVHLSEDIRKVEVGYHLAEAAWGSGYATEALGALLQFFFREVGVDKVTARYDARNPASGRVLIKNGFRKEGVMRREAAVNAGIGDWVMMGLLREEYLLQFGQDQ